MVNDLWYKNAIVYCLSVGTFMDANGDGIGDFQGLMRRLDYLQGLGITTIWLMPFQPSPCRDNGYDISDYYNVDPRYGTLGDFTEFTHACRQRGLRVLIDLVVNHTSDQHAWFKEARRDPQSKYRDWYVWSKKKPANAKDGVVFPGVQKSTWTYDKEASMWYFHRFYDFQPDLNTANPYVQAELLKIMGFWIQLGVSGFRMDAVPFVIATKGAQVKKPVEQYDMLRTFREFLQWREGDAIILAEANVLPDTDMQYFGDEGERLQMMFNFQVNQNTFYALASADTGPLKKALLATKARAATAQWGVFLRNHDELDLGRLAPQQRETVFAAFGPDPGMQLYERGIRRRLAPMLDGDRHRLELAYSLMLTLPGTPVVRYGDEIGMGDDLRLPERECARTPMQWSTEPHGGFTKHPRPVSRGHFGRALRVRARQRREPAARSEFAAELDGADDPHAQGSARNQLGRFRDPAHLARRRARDPLRLAQQLGRLRAQLQRGRMHGEIPRRPGRRGYPHARQPAVRRSRRGGRGGPSYRRAGALRIPLVSRGRAGLSAQAQRSLRLSDICPESCWRGADTCAAPRLVMRLKRPPYKALPELARSLH